MKRNNVMNYEQKYKEALEKQGGTSKEWTISDAATFKELIDFLENGTAKLQHDLTRYANWLKIQFTPIEKQGEQKSILNVPPREVILSIWDLGNEWKELTNGSISTEYGTQLDYIQKHWTESEYYLREKQDEQTINQPDFEIPFGAKDSELIEESYYIPKGYHAEISKDKVTIKKGEQNPIEFKWSTDDKNKLLIIEQILNCADLLISSQELTEIKNWLKSLKQRIGE